MINQTDFAAIAALDLDRIKTKLCHAESGESWSRARVDAAEVEYRRFLYLMKAFPNEQTVPSVEVDTFWHYHILDTMHYAADCSAAFGYFLHHDPAVGLAGASEAPERFRRAARMDALYRATFGALPAATGGKSWCGAAVSYCGSAVSYCGSAVSYCGAAVSYCGAAVSYCGFVGPSTTWPAAAPANAIPA